MTHYAIHADGLSKEYTIRAAQPYRTVREDLVRAIAAPLTRLRRGREHRIRNERIWALRDVSFTVEQGEVVGIIGRNGAGKSTLLKILSRITAPSEGEVAVRGRIVSLLEVGTGFHPELTGRENIFLNGAILGMTRREVQRKFDEILDFAGVERFVDTPVKHYSSGMHMRLAFAVAAHLETDLLLVDEVLAVGDASFQKKCVAKMQDVAGHGRTVLFVSHNLGAITSLCSSAVWLDCGSIRQRGDTRDVVGEYLAQGMSSQERIVRLDHFKRGDGHIFLESVEWLSSMPLRHGQPLKARIRFETRAPLSDLAIGIGFSGLEGKRLLTYETDFPDGVRPSIIHPGHYWVDVEVESLPLGPDIYNLDIGCRSGDFHSVAYIPACVQLEIVAGPTTPGTIVRKDSGVRLPSEWSWSIQDNNRRQPQDRLSSTIV